MAQTIEALFDGSAILPDKPLLLEANTRVRVTIEELPTVAQLPRSFLKTARSLRLQGPVDCDTKLDKYVYGAENESIG